MNEFQQLFMQRCLELAENGLGFTSPNPVVGCVIVFENKIIGEGFHQYFGGPHAEVNAVNDALKKGNSDLLDKSTMYVSLEPCSHFGKTPPCTTLILEKKIPRVIIGCKDPFESVNGKGIEILKSSGVHVKTEIEKEKCLWMNRRFFTFHQKNRPYVLLKFAKTTDNFLAPVSDIKSKKISNEFSDVLVHRWRSEESSILVGTRTAESDNPNLTVRKWKGNNPVRIVIDRNLRLPDHLNIFDQSVKTIVINEKSDRVNENITHIRINFQENIAAQILEMLYRENLLSVMVEGGSRMLSQFITAGLWDEARIITSRYQMKEGIQAPHLSGKLISSADIAGDLVQTFIRN